MKIQTKTGVHEIPDDLPITPRSRWWAETVTNVIKPEEMYLLLETALREAYDAGRAEAMTQFLKGWHAKREIVEADYQVVPEGGAGPECEQSVAVSQADGSAEPAVASGSLHGGAEEVPPSQQPNKEEVA